MVINNNESAYSTIVCGVPQGSVLGPVLFSLYINDFPKTLVYSKALMYADDTAIVFTEDSLSALRANIMSEFTHVSNWFIQNKLTLHSGKTKYVVFRSRRNDIDTASMQLYLNNSRIEQVVSFKYLGVFFDQHLHWEEKIHSVSRKVAYGCYALIKARECFPPSVLRTLYFSFCHSHISYCIESWGVTYTIYLEPLLRLQKRALSIIGGNHGNLYKTTFQEQQILSVRALRDYKVALFVQKIIGTSFPLSSTLFTIPSRNTIDTHRMAILTYLQAITYIENAY